MIVVRQCKIADRDHKRSKRQYAHTYHINECICVAKAFSTLPLQHRMAILAHEIGHVLINDVDHFEREADTYANRFFKIVMKRKTSEYGARLQYLTFNDTMKVVAWANKNIIFR